MRWCGDPHTDPFDCAPSLSTVTNISRRAIMISFPFGLFLMSKTAETDISLTALQKATAAGDRNDHYSGIQKKGKISGRIRNLDTKSMRHTPQVIANFFFR
jgi:hypothetical protein